MSPQIDQFWSAQDLISLDKVPYIGQMTSDDPNILVATGFAKWGMTNGIAAGLLLSDLLTGTPNRFRGLFDPNRSKLNKQDAKQFAKNNADVAIELLKGKVSPASQSADDLKLDEGGLVRHAGKTVGGYRDESGELHLVKTTCTHMGCDVKWNNGERSWDCPCHGSRFDYRGKCLRRSGCETVEKTELMLESSLLLEAVFLNEVEEILLKLSFVGDSIVLRPSDLKYFE